MSRDFIGNSVSVGTGIKAYFRINGTYLKDGKTAVFEVGLLNDLIVETNRDVAPQFVAGNRSAISYCSGKRLTSGKVSFAVFEKDFIGYFIDAYKDKINTFSDFNSNQFGFEYTDDESKKESSFLIPSDVNYLDQLPPVIIVESK